MINFEKMDEQDFIFLDQPWTESEKREFSAFLKSRKAKQKEPDYKPSLRTNPRTHRTSETV